MIENMIAIKDKEDKDDAINNMSAHQD